MKNFFKKLYYWCRGTYHSIMMNIAIALANTEIDLLKADPNDLDDRHKKIQRFLHRNQLMEKFYAGQRDEKYVKEFYELLKKADKFLRESTPHEIALGADRNKTTFGQKDKWGRRHEHFGFFDEKHKHAGKTLKEVFDEEYKLKRTKDDNYELIHIFDNKPIEVGISKMFDYLKEKDPENEVYEAVDMQQRSKKFKFPITIIRDGDVVNKIEQVAEYLHVKKIGLDHVQLEFFIPLKFKTNIHVKEGDKIFKQLTEIKEVHAKNDYGEFISFGTISYSKRVIHNDTHEVFKFTAVQMKVYK